MEGLPFVSHSPNLRSNLASTTPNHFRSPYRRRFAFQTSKHPPPEMAEPETVIGAVDETVVVEKFTESETHNPLECCGTNSKYGVYGPLTATVSLFSTGAYIVGIVFQRIFDFKIPAANASAKLGLFLACSTVDGNEDCTSISFSCKADSFTFQPCDSFTGMRFLIVAALAISVAASVMQVGALARFYPLIHVTFRFALLSTSNVITLSTWSTCEIALSNTRKATNAVIAHCSCQEIQLHPRLAIHLPVQNHNVQIQRLSKLHHQRLHLLPLRLISMTLNIFQGVALRCPSTE